MKQALFVCIVLLSVGSLPAVAQEVSFDAIASRAEQNFDIPTITKIVVIPSSTGARIEWETDRAAQSFLEYGPSPAYGSQMPFADGARTSSKNHQVEIGGLAGFQTYHFRIRAQIEQGYHEVFSRPLTFTTRQSGGFAEKPLLPTPTDFSAPAVTSLTFKEREVGVQLDLATNESAFIRFEYGMYVKGSPFLFEERESTAESVEKMHAVLSSITPGSVFLYRITTQDKLGNKAVFYGNFQTRVQQKQSEPKEAAAQKRAAPAIPHNSVLITNPSQLSGIPQQEIWKDESSGRLYRIFKSMPPGAVLLTHPSQLVGLTSFQVWKDEKTGRLYRHAGIPNPERSSRAPLGSNDAIKSNAPKESKESSQNKEFAIPQNWIRITDPVQLKVLFPSEVWRDERTGMMYRKIGAAADVSEKSSPLK